MEEQQPKETMHEFYTEHKKAIIIAVIILIAIILFATTDTADNALGYIIKKFSIS